jgi:hypothetical protein
MPEIRSEARYATFINTFRCKPAVALKGRAGDHQATSASWNRGALRGTRSAARCLDGQEQPPVLTGVTT